MSEIDQLDNCIIWERTEEQIYFGIKKIRILEIIQEKNQDLCMMWAWLIFNKYFVSAV